MRICYIHDSAIPGAEASTVNVTKTCSALAAEGHEVTLVHFAAAGSRSEGLFNHYGISQRFGTLALPIGRKRPGAARLIAWTAAILARTTGRETVVYARKPALLVPAARLGMNVGLEMHSPLGEEQMGNREALRTLASSGRLVAVVCISEALAREIGRSHPELAPLLSVAHDGADEASGPLPAPPRGERPLIGYSGHMYPGKGMEMIEALARRRPDWQFLALGGLPADLARWRAQAADLPNLEMPGLVPHSQVAGRLERCDVVLAPYGKSVTVSDGRTDVARWMSPLKLFEYMALGRPMVVSDLPVIREVLKDGENALLAAPDDAAAWEQAVDSLLADRAAASALAERARLDLAQKFSWRRRARMIAEALAG